MRKTGSHMVQCPCLPFMKGRAVTDRFFRHRDGRIVPACGLCHDNSSLSVATVFDEETRNEYICQDIMES